MPTIFEKTKDQDTIIYRLGHILKVAESKYGERVNKYNLLGVDITDADYPGNWFPPWDPKYFAIYLTHKALKDMNEAVGQLAHEIIHFLSPTGADNANFLEEGLAVHFSYEYTKSNGYEFKIDKDSENYEKYQRALDLYEKLISIDAYIIKKIRINHPTISLIKSEDLINENNNIPKDLADQLTKKF